MGLSVKPSTGHIHTVPKENGKCDTLLGYDPLVYAASVEWAIIGIYMIVGMGKLGNRN